MPTAAVTSHTQLAETFQRVYGTQPRIFQAPGRVNLIGEHVDYNDGYVLPMALEFQTLVAAAPNRVDQIRVHSDKFEQSVTAPLSEIGRPRRDWSDYILGVAAMLSRAGVELRGMDLWVASDVPIGAGLSSSAAVEVASAFAFLAVAGATMERMDIARLCQRAENEFVGIRSGLMDQFTACFGIEDHALLLDCRSLYYTPIPLPRDSAVIVCDTRVKHELASSEYNLRREDCETAAAYFGIPSLRDLSPERLEKEAPYLPDRVYRRARHVVSEIQRVLEAGDALRRADPAVFGKLMYQSHESLRMDYEVSSRELDIMVEIARSLPGIHGARMTGGGFGGATVNLVAAQYADAFQSDIRRLYEQETGITPDVYRCRAAPGASEVNGQ
jgi:galactokinase